MNRYTLALLILITCAITGIFMRGKRTTVAPVDFEPVTIDTLPNVASTTVTGSIPADHDLDFITNSTAYTNVNFFFKRNFSTPHQPPRMNSPFFVTFCDDLYNVSSIGAVRIFTGSEGAINVGINLLGRTADNYYPFPTRDEAVKAVRELESQINSVSGIPSLP